MAKLINRISFLISSIIIITASSCQLGEPQLDYVSVLTQGKWLITQHTISPGVRFGNTISSPIITDIKAVFTCKENNKYSGAYIYFEKNGQITTEITCSNSVDAGKKLSEGNRWELSSDRKTFILFDNTSNTSYTITSFKPNVFKLSGKENYQDAYSKQNILQDVFITFTKV